jgi:hypothetical protein
MVLPLISLDITEKIPTITGLYLGLNLLTRNAWKELFVWKKSIEPFLQEIFWSVIRTIDEEIFTKNIFFVQPYAKWAFRVPRNPISRLVP